MTVKHVEQFHGKSNKQLENLSTEHLLEILESARGRKVERDGLELSPEDIQWNLFQSRLTRMVKKVLETRPHHEPTPKQVHHHEKKVMKY